MRRPSRLAAGAVAAVLVLVVPPLAFAQGDMRVIVTMLAFAICALGLDLLVGQTGQLSLAHAAFFGVGFYTTINIGTRTALPLGVVAAVAVTALVAVIVGLPSLRIRGLQIAITTLAFQVFAERYVFKDPTLTANGRALVRPEWLSEYKLYYLGLALIALVVFIRFGIDRTRAGRSFVAVRDVEGRAVAFGIEPGPTKLLAYGLSGAIAGLGGALFAIQQGELTQLDNFNLQASLLLVAIVVVGGARSAPGILVAAFFVKALPSLKFIRNVDVPVLGELAPLIPIVFAIGLVVSIVLQPQGIGGVLRDAGGGLDALLRGRPERPSPRPMPTDPIESAHKAAHLRDVPRSMRERMPVPSLLVGRDVTVQYGGVRALGNVSLEVRRGEIVGLIGANGAGKSTFFNATSGLAPTTGSITYRGRELVNANPAKRSRAGVARTFQDMGLVRANTVRENILLAQGWMASYPAPAGILGLFSAIPTERELRLRADLALELFGLDHLAGETLGGLPYGTMRIVEIAAAVAAGPDLLMLDEATAGLTPEEAYQLGDRFLALRDELGLTLMVIEHHVPLIARVCDYCYCLESGELIAEGAPNEVTAQPRVIESFLGKGSLREANA